MKNILPSLLAIILLLSINNTAKSQSYNRTLKEEVFINSDTKNIELNFTQKGKYKVFQGSNQQNIDWNKPTIVTKNKLILSRTSPRPFFGVITPKRDTLIVAERKLIINDLDNFRDLGGIKNKDGRYVLWGKFYRSDALNELLTTSFTYIEDLHINKVFDLRSEFEIAKAKDNLPKNVIYEHFPIFADNDSGMLQGLQQKLEKGTFTQEEAEELMMKTYESFANDDAPKFNTLLHQIIVQDSNPNVFHCTAGKDRTGYTAAMILAILKVDRQTILDEYDMTNFYTETKIKEYMANVDKLGFGTNIQPAAIAAVMSVNKKYLEKCFAIIDAKYGGIDSFIKNQLGFSDQEREEIIKKYTYIR